MDAGIHSAIRGTSRIRALFANRRVVDGDGAERAEDLRRDRGGAGAVAGAGATPAKVDHTHQEYARRLRFTSRDSRCTTMPMADLTMAMVVWRHPFCVLGTALTLRSLLSSRTRQPPQAVQTKRGSRSNLLKQFFLRQNHHHFDRCGHCLAVAGLSRRQKRSAPRLTPTGTDLLEIPMMAISGCPPTDDPAKVPDNPAKVQVNPERTYSSRAPSPRARIRSAGISGLLVIKLVRLL